LYNTLNTKQTDQTFFAIKLRLQYLLTLNRFKLSRCVSNRKSFIVSNRLSTSTSQMRLHAY